VPNPKPETRIIACKRCGIHTRHEYEVWVQRPLALRLLTGRVKIINAWRCTKCGKHRSARTRYAIEKDM
jgi:ribosomal protein L37E